MTQASPFFVVTFFRLHRPNTRQIAAVVKMKYLFTSRAHTYMGRVEWDWYPLFLFSDEKKIGPEAFEKFQKNDVSSVTKYNAQTGLPEGHSILSTMKLFSPATRRCLYL